LPFAQGTALRASQSRPKIPSSDLFARRHDV
jgi:hypothetical protein